MRVSVNLNDVDRPVPLSPGIYEATIKGAKMKPKRGDSPDNLSVLEVEYSVAREDGKASTLFDNLSIKPQALWHIQDLFRACGLTWNEAGSIDTENLLGALLRLDIYMEEWQGRDRPKVKAYLPLA